MEEKELIAALKPLIGKVICATQPECYGGNSGVFLVKGIKHLRDNQRAQADCTVLIQRDSTEGFVMNPACVTAVEMLADMCLLKGRTLDDDEATIVVHFAESPGLL